MDDARLLLAAAAADPADDLTRLVYADAREDQGDENYARFVREQVRLAPLPSWHPEQVRVRWHEPGLLTGEPFASELPPSRTRAWHWPDRHAFDRGLPGTVVVRDLTGFVDYAAELFDALPIRELHLPTAALSEWRRFAARPWLPRIQTIRFYGVSTPIEALRVLSDAPLATGLTTLALEKAGGPAVPLLLADLFAAPLGKQLRRLELHARTDEDWIDSFADLGESHALRELSLTNLSLTAEGLSRLTAAPWAGRLTTFESRHNPLHTPFGISSPTWTNLERLTIFDSAASVLLRLGDPNTVGQSRLKQVECGHTPGSQSWPQRTPQGLTSLGLSRCGVPASAVPHMVRSEFWQHAVELDLRGNMLYRHGLELLIDAGPGPELVALILDRGHATKPLGRQFADRYEDRVAFA